MKLLISQKPLMARKSTRNTLGRRKATMNRIIVTTKVSSDGNVHLDVPVGADEVGADVQVTVEPIDCAGQRTLSACDLLNSGLVGIWEQRADIGDSRDFARRLREQAQMRER